MDQRRLIARRQRAQQQFGRRDAGDRALHQAVQQDRGRHTPRVARFARRRPRAVDLVSVARRSPLGADDVSFDHLAESRALQAAGEVFCDLRVAQVHVIRRDEPGVCRALVPDPAHYHGQQAQRTARFLEIGDRRHPQGQRVEEFRVKRISRRQRLGIFRRKRLRGQSHILLVPTAVSLRVRLRCLSGGLGVNSRKQPVAHNRGDLRLARGGDDPLLPRRNFIRFGQL